MKNNQKTVFSILCVLGVALAASVFFCLLFFNKLHAALNDFALPAIIALVVLELLLVVFSVVLIFSKGFTRFIIPAVTAIICCVAAFACANSASADKLASDYLKNEAAFNKTVDALKQQHITVNGTALNIDEGIFPLEEKDLHGVVCTKTVQIAQTSGSNAVFFFICYDDDTRSEGYIYSTDGTVPKEWEDSIAFSDALDINGYWYYAALYK